MAAGERVEAPPDGQAALLAGQRGYHPVYPLPPTVSRPRRSSHEEVNNPAMAKRVRGSVRPGQRRSIERRSTAAAAASPAAPVTATPRPSGLTEAETKRAAELEAAMLAEERAAEAARKRPPGRIPREVTGGGTLAVRAQEEYAYVARDVRRIARIAALLLAILLVIYILVDVAKVFPVS